MTGRSSAPNAFVRKIEGFVALTDAERAVLEEVGAPSILVKAGTTLVEEGQSPGGVILVLQGMAYRYKLRANGHRQIMAYLVPGDLSDVDVDLLGEMDHSIATFSECRVVRLSRETVHRLRRHQGIARGLRMGALVDEATLREWLLNLGGRSAIERLAHLLCEVHLRLDAVGLSRDAAYAFPLTQTDLADTTGMTPVHVNRSLMELRRRGLVALGQRSMQILNLPELRKLAEFRANYLHLGVRSVA